MLPWIGGWHWLRGTALDLELEERCGWMDRTRDGRITWPRARAAEVAHPFHRSMLTGVSRVETGAGNRQAEKPLVPRRVRRDPEK